MPFLAPKYALGKILCKTFLRAMVKVLDGSEQRIRGVQSKLFVILVAKILAPF